ncbi:chl4 family chromosome segregation protein [Diplodia corticola]|uniref:Chl4 family chromosome segregation protein n=1 Tax=Diplodia corticola TaxID=236234 RepID=A0A1J9QND8_9PEZI|nr:chl4 family chromosome segregation protein [Diplodia corticola]OJD29976.1 chl4 family chromosome segregation protein [Diplodia corticola]
MSRKTLTVPTNAALPHIQRLPADSPDVAKTLSRLSRQSLLELVLEWLDKKNRDFCEPYLAHASDDDEDDESPYTPATSEEEIVEVYKELRARKGGKREVVDRIVEGDWRHGITLYQLAMAETRYLLDHPNSLRWNALQLSKVTGSGGSSADGNIEVIDESTATSLPRFNATTFVLNLQKEVAPVTRAHYYITRVKAFGISLLRVHIHDSPYNHALPGSAPSGSEGSKSVFLVFPDGSPYVYVSLATNLGQTVGVEGRSLRKVVVDAVPKALSRPHSRYALTTTSLSSRSLSTLLSLRGPGRSNAAPAGWSIFAENSFGHDALDYDARVNRRQSSNGKAEDSTEGTFNSTPLGGGKRGRVQKDDAAAKRRKSVAEARFGPSAKESDGKGLERLDIRMEDPFPSTSQPQTDEESWTPDVHLSFQGSHVFAGVRQLVEQGIIDGEKMPGWMAGDAGVSVGAVKEGRVREKA